MAILIIAAKVSQQRSTVRINGELSLLHPVTAVVLEECDLLFVKFSPTTIIFFEWVKAMLGSHFEFLSFSSKYFQLISNQRSLIGLVNGQLTWYCTRSKKLFHTNGQLLSQKWMHSALSVRDYDKRSKKEEYNISVQIKGRGIDSFIQLKKYGGARYDHSKRHHSFFGGIEFHLSHRKIFLCHQWMKHQTEKYASHISTIELLSSYQSYRRRYTQINNNSSNRRDAHRKLIDHRHRFNPSSSSHWK